MIDRIAPRFARYEPLRHAAELMAGMVSGLDRKNCWTIAEHRGDATPDGLQHLLSRAKWDAEAVRDDLRDYVIDAFGDPGAVLVLDETGDVKKGVHSVGVQRQYTGTAGRIENAQVAVYLTYAAPRGHALIDRALYLPRRGPRIRIAAMKRESPPNSGVSRPNPRWRQPWSPVPLRRRFPRRGWPATRSTEPIPGCAPPSAVTVWAMCWPWRPTGASPPPAGPIRVDQLPAGCPNGPGRNIPPAPAATAHASTRGPGSTLLPEDDTDTGRHHLLIRRNDATGELAYLRCYSPRPVTLHTLVSVTGQRWRIEESFQAAKGLTGLDQHQVRRWTSWHRWTTLAMLAHAFLAVATATERDAQPTPDRTDHVDRQRISPSLRRSAPRHPPHHHDPAGLVTLATTTPIPSPSIPLPTTRTPMITN